jgi:hypothetical protein
VSDEEKKHEKKKHERHIIGRVHFNNIDLSHHAKHDWKADHEARHKARAEAKAKEAKTETAAVTVNAYFQKLGIPEPGGEDEWEWVSADDPSLEPEVRTPIPLPGGLAYLQATTLTGDQTVKDLLEYFAGQGQYGDDFVVNFVTATTTPPTSYIENMEIAGESYNKTPDTVGYNPNDQLPPPDDTYMTWTGVAWMYIEGVYNSNETKFDPNDQYQYNPNDPGHADGGYPEATVDEFPLECLPQDPNGATGVRAVTFSFEYHAFGFTYEEREIEGVKKMVLVLKALRRRKKKK